MTPRELGNTKSVIGRGPDNDNNNNNNPRRIRGSEKRKTSNEGRTHSPALLRRPTIYVVGKNMNEMPNRAHTEKT